MAQSPILGADRAPRRPRATSTELLGPSDLSDSGSDLVGADGAVDTDDIGLDGGTNDDIRRAAGAGADIGDADLDADTDAGGTGERAEAGRDTLRNEAPDILPDQVFSLSGDDDVLAEDEDLMAAGGIDDDEEDEQDEDDAGKPARPGADKSLD